MGQEQSAPHGPWSGQQRSFSSDGNQPSIIGPDGLIEEDGRRSSQYEPAAASAPLASQIQSANAFMDHARHFRPITSIPASAGPDRKILKLSMNINMADGRISGRCLAGPSAPSALSQVPSAAFSSFGGGSSCPSNGGMNSVDGMNDLFHAQNLHLLYKTEADLMMDALPSDESSSFYEPGLIHERRYLQNEVVRRMESPGGQQTNGLLLYGPKANGKTFLARTAASLIHKSCIFVLPYYFDCEDPYTRLLAIFKLAVEKGCPIIFKNIDESFRDKRNLQLLFASEFARISGQKKRLLVIATLDDSCYTIPEEVRNCFLDRLKVWTPSVKERGDMLSAFLSRVPNSLTKSEFQRIVKCTHMYTRGQLSFLCRKATNFPPSPGGDVRPVDVVDFRVVLDMNDLPSLPYDDDGSSDHSSLMMETLHDDGMPSTSNHDADPSDYSLD